MFLVNSLPDITTDTRILAVCGISDEQENAASPEHDGWFYSDFFAFHTLLYGKGAAQKWCCSDKPASLFQKYGRYLHGNPTEQRVVLNEALIKTELQDVHVFSASNLLASCFELLREEAAIAAQQKAPFFLFLFGHGAEVTRSVEIGMADNKLDISTVTSVAGDDIDLTVISTACYSGGWAIFSPLSRKVQFTTEVGELWPKIPSLSRAYGSIYASSLIKSLTKESSYLLNPPQKYLTGQDISSTSANQQSEAFREFSLTVHALLLRACRSGYQQGISFSTQDDDWGSYIGYRTVLSLTDLKSKWESLELVPSQIPPLYRDVGAEPDMKTDGISLSSIRGQYGSISLYTGQLRRLAATYLASYPGRDSLAPNSSLHRKCRDLISKRKGLSLSTLEAIESTLGYRLSLNFLANKLVLGFRLPLPKDKRCEEWDPIHKAEYQCEEYKSINERLYPLFPQPLPNQGRGWNKPRWYIVAAVMEAGLSPTELDLKIQSLLDATHAIEKSQENVLLDSPVIRSKLRQLA